MLRTLSAVSVLASVAVAVSACGSSKTETTAPSNASATAPPVSTTPVKVTAGTPLPRAQFIAAGDAICARTNDKFGALGAHNSAQFVRALPQAAIYYASESEELSKLVAPKSTAHDWEQIVDDIHLTGEYADSVVQSLQAKQQRAATQALKKAEELRKDTLRIAKRDGFKWCALGRPPRRGE